MNNIIWTFDDADLEKRIIGPVNQTLNLINAELDINITHINNHLIMETVGFDRQISIVSYLIKILKEFKQKDIKWQERDLIHILTLLKNSSNLDAVKENVIDFYQNKLLILNTFEGKKIYAKTLMQKNYIEALNKSSIVFVTGSAGTGKTYLAVAYAVNALKKNEIKKIVITRPVVEAGEKLGFLPGDLKEKINPYLVPIYDALNEFLGKETVEKYIEKGIIEISPLAYMRGRTLSNAIIILDEAQNTTNSQMKMFITRLGFSSKIIVTGDITQIDLSSNIKSGLIEATKILKGIPGISLIHFNNIDVMRNPLVAKVIERYEEVEKNDTL